MKFLHAVIKIQVLSIFIISSAHSQGLGGIAPSTDSYINMAKQKAQMITKAKVVGRARNTINNQFYGGAESDDVVQAYEDDADIHFGSNFDACMSLVTITMGCEFSDLHLYWWPVNTVNIGNFSETQYATKDMYEEFNPEYEKKSGDGHYGKAPKYAVDGIKRASRLVGGEELTAQEIDPRVEELPESMRFLHGSDGGMTVRDYHLTPTLAQMAWAFGMSSFGDYAEYSSELATDSATELRMNESDKFEDLCHVGIVPAERFSDIAAMAEPARNVGWSVANFDSEMSDLEENPLMCTQQNIDNGYSPDFLQPLVDVIGGDGGTIVNPPGELACVPGWGRARPVTMYGHDVMTDLSVAGIAAIKAINTSAKVEGLLKAIDFTYPADKLQWLRPMAMGHMCLPAGMAGAATLGMSSFDLNRNPGTAVVTHWKFIGCCRD